MQIMDILQKLAFISMILDFDLLKIMQFNDLYPLYRHTGSFTKLTQKYIWNYEQVDGILWNIKTLRLHMFKTIYLIVMKFTDVM